jgi:hypothetical protein
MTSTLTPTCSLCGLRFENRPLLELHLREDHPQRGASAEPDRSTPAAAPVSRPRPRGPASPGPEPATASRTKAGPGTGSPRPPRRAPAGWAGTALRRVIGAFRRGNAELLLASEAMLRLPGDPRRPADPPARPDAHQAAASERTDRAA